jgi:hypothetical protein
MQSMVIHTCNLSTQEAEARDLLVPGRPRLQSKIKACLGYIARLCLERRKKREERKVGMEGRREGEREDEKKKEKVYN